MDSVSISVPARLHLGFLDINGSFGRKFGSLGMALSNPLTRLTLTRSAETRVSGYEGERAKRYLRQITAALGIQEGFELSVAEAIPAHAGLGSGTQLALGIAAAVRLLSGYALDPRSDADLLDRGVRSGIGIGLFSGGGLVLDAGRNTSSGPPPIVSRQPFPDEWRIILILDHDMEGVHGEAELEAFARLPPFPEEESAQLCRIALFQVLPAVIEKDLMQFGLAIAEIQRRLGEYFAPAQGGRYTSSRVARIAEGLAKAGAHGCGQSSWGPTGFAFVANEAEAESLLSRIDDGTREPGLELRIVKGNNEGARVNP